MSHRICGIYFTKTLLFIQNSSLPGHAVLLFAKSGNANPGPVLNLVFCFMIW